MLSPSFVSPGETPMYRHSNRCVGRLCISIVTTIIVNTPEISSVTTIEHGHHDIDDGGVCGEASDDDDDVTLSYA